MTGSKKKPAFFEKSRQENAPPKSRHFPVWQLFGSVNEQFSLFPLVERR
jgi:hypothetical protein